MWYYITSFLIGLSIGRQLGESHLQIWALLGLKLISHKRTLLLAMGVLIEIAGRS